MLCFPYTFLIREIWKVPKKQGNSLPVLYFDSVCFPFSLIIPLAGMGHDLSALVCQDQWVCAHPAMGSLLHSTQPLLPLARYWPILQWSLSVVRECTGLNIQDHTLHIQSSLNFYPSASLAAWRMEFLTKWVLWHFWKFGMGSGILNYTLDLRISWSLHLADILALC